MQVDAENVLDAIGAVLNISSREEDDEDKIDEQTEYIVETLEENNIDYEGVGGGQYLMYNSDIINAVEAFHLSLEGSWTEDCGNGHVLIDLTGNDDVDATLYYTFSEDNITSLSALLLYK